MRCVNQTGLTAASKCGRVYLFYTPVIVRRIHLIYLCARREFSSSSFTLPDNADHDHISANYHDGLPEIELKKPGKSAAAKKEIKVD